MASRRDLRAIVLLGLVVHAVAGRCAFAVEPLTHAHSHNDYWRERPLLDALDRRFTSVEADILLIDGKLLIGHDRDELHADKTLESLYLDPLLKRVRENGGRVYRNGPRLILLVDIKSDAHATYRQLHATLSKYVQMLTSVERGKIHERAVKVVISGNRPPVEDFAAAEVRYAGLDGRTTDLESGLPAHVMPMISDNWTSQFTWTGDGPMPAAERANLHDIVRRAHAAGRVVRFWATPENEAVWQELRSAGVDLINTDQLDRLAAFLRTSKSKTPRQ
jgi:glycerophosphoryl diester phosphodiesterase